MNIECEDDLWRLFGGKSCEKPGTNELTYAEFFDQSSVLDIGVKNKNRPFRPKFKVTLRDRLYRLRSSDVEAVVHQARVYDAARRIGDPEMRVSYLGKVRDVT